MLVTTAIVGVRRRNEPSLSSASATSMLPSPRRALLPRAAIRPPTTTVGSKPAARSTVATSEVVVVFVVDRARVHDHIRVAHVLGAVTDVDAHAQAFEILGVLARAQIGAGHVELERAQDFGEAAHADAADADEVHVSNATAEHLDGLP